MQLELKGKDKNRIEQVTKHIGFSFETILVSFYEENKGEGKIF